MIRRAAWTVLVIAGLSGCKTTLPDPHDPKQASKVTAEQLQANLRAAYETLARRAAKGEFPEDQVQPGVKRQAEAIIAGLDLDRLPTEDLWRYAEIFITAERWDLAANALQLALKAPPNDDRRVNDTLRYARCLAHLGKVEEAIMQVRTTFNVVPGGKAPILLAVYLEIVPAARGKGFDSELAKLTMEAIEQHLQTTVDPNTEAGAAFLKARRTHVLRAQQLAATLTGR